VKSAKNYLIVLLALTTAAGGYISLRQYNELISLRAAKLADAQRDAWNQRRAATPAPAPIAEKAHEAVDAAADEAHEDQSAPPERRPRRNRGDARSFFDNPQAQKLVALQQRAALDGRYAELFKKLRLTPAQLDQFKNLLVEKQSAMMDVMAAARAQGLDPRRDRDEYRALVAQTQAELDNNIQAVLGDGGFSEYQRYQQTLPQRATAEQFAQRLSYTSTPLSALQTEQLIQIFSQTSKPSPADAAARGNFLSSLGMGGGGVAISDGALTQAQGVLSPDQLAALQQFQQEQVTQQQLMRSLRPPARPATSGAPAAAAVPATSGGGG
jgi:hypothetical protein